MCLRVWSHLGFVSNSDIKVVIILPDVPADAKKDPLVEMLM
jgi:hypothetical protein